MMQEIHQLYFFQLPSSSDLWIIVLFVEFQLHRVFEYIDLNIKEKKLQYRMKFAPGLVECISLLSTIRGVFLKISEE